MKEKQVFDYKEPFQAPYMVREITKKFRLRNAVSGQSIFVAGFTCLATIALFEPFIGFGRVLICLCIFLPYGMVELFNRIEPDGKKVHAFLIDYLKFAFTYQLSHHSIQQAKLLKVRKTKMSYHRESVQDLLIQQQPKVRKE